MQNQNSVLERDINRRELLAGRRHDSVLDKNLKMCDPKKSKGLDQALQVTKVIFNMSVSIISVNISSFFYFFGQNFI